MKAIVSALIEVSIYSSVVALAIIAFRAAFHRKLSPKLQYAIWLILIARLIMPVSIESGLHLNVFSTAIKAPYISVEAPKAAAPAADIAPSGSAGKTGGESAATIKGDSGGGSPKYVSAEPAAPAIHADASTIALSVWLVGVASIAIWFNHVKNKYYFSMRSAVIKTPPDTARVFAACCDELCIKGDVQLMVVNANISPGITLFLKPTVLIPLTLSPQRLRFALLHELSHYKRKDHIMYVIVNVLRCVYWFNPLIHIAFSLMQQDMEAACDARVLAHIGAASKRDYLTTIIELFSYEALPQLGMALTSARSAAKRRIQSAFMKQSSTLPARIGVCALSAALLFMCFTTACQSAPESKSITAVPLAASPISHAAAPASLTADALTLTAEKAPLEAVKHGRGDVLLPRIFDAMSADSSFASFTFEMSRDRDVAEVEAAYQALYDGCVSILKRFPASTPEKPHFFVLDFDNKGQPFKEPMYTGSYTLIPYAVIADGSLLEAVARGLFYMSEPWTAYGLAGYVSASDATDKALFSDTEALYLTGMSYQAPFASDKIRASSKALAAGLFSHIVQKYGEEEAIKLLGGSSSLNIYSEAAEWSGIENSYLKAHPDVLYHKYAQTGHTFYDVILSDGASQFHIKQSITGSKFFTSPYAVYSYLDRFYSGLERIKAYAAENGIRLAREAFELYMDEDYAPNLGFVSIPDGKLYFSQRALETSLEWFTLTCAIGVQVDSPPFDRGGLVLKIEKDIFGFERYEHSDNTPYKVFKDLTEGRIQADEIAGDHWSKYVTAGLGYYLKQVPLSPAVSDINYKAICDAYAYMWIMERGGSANIDLTSTKETDNYVYGAACSSYFEYVISNCGYTMARLVEIAQGESVPADFYGYTGEWAKGILEEA